MDRRRPHPVATTRVTARRRPPFTPPPSAGTGPRPRGEAGDRPRAFAQARGCFRRRRVAAGRSSRYRGLWVRAPRGLQTCSFVPGVGGCEPETNHQRTIYPGPCSPWVGEDRQRGGEVSGRHGASAEVGVQGCRGPGMPELVGEVNTTPAEPHDSIDAVRRRSISSTGTGRATMRSEAVVLVRG
jgi:hypothetical protein